jgi:hypothetical protein
MERRSNQAESPRLAAVVRQFTASRIEQQLLAQVFECLMGMRPGEPLAAHGAVDNQQRTEDLHRADGNPSRGAARSAA